MGVDYLASSIQPPLSGIVGVAKDSEFFLFLARVPWEGLRKKDSEFSRVDGDVKFIMKI